MAQQPQKITKFIGVSIGETCKLDGNQLLSSNGDAITFPAAGGELALKSDIVETDLSNCATVEALNAQKDRIDRLLAYLEEWIDCGNITFSGISDAVNGE